MRLLLILTLCFSVVKCSLYINDRVEEVKNLIKRLEQISNGIVNYMLMTEPNTELIMKKNEEIRIPVNKMKKTLKLLLSSEVDSDQLFVSLNESITDMVIFVERCEQLNENIILVSQEITSFRSQGVDLRKCWRNVRLDHTVRTFRQFINFMVSNCSYVEKELHYKFPEPPVLPLWHSLLRECDEDEEFSICLNNIMTLKENLFYQKGNLIPLFHFYTTVNYILCWHAITRFWPLRFFTSDSCGNEENAIPYACAQKVFCPDPCYGICRKSRTCRSHYSDSNEERKSSGRKVRTHKPHQVIGNNPCYRLASYEERNSTCKLEMYANSDLHGIIRNQWNYSCTCSLKLKYLQGTKNFGETPSFSRELFPLSVPSKLHWTVLDVEDDPLPICIDVDECAKFNRYIDKDPLSSRYRDDAICSTIRMNGEWKNSICQNQLASYSCNCPFLYRKFRYVNDYFFCKYDGEQHKSFEESYNLLPLQLKRLFKVTRAQVDSLNPYVRLNTSQSADDDIENLTKRLSGSPLTFSHYVQLVTTFLQNFLYL